MAQPSRNSSCTSAESSRRDGSSPASTTRTSAGFSSADIKEHVFWDEYQAAFEDALTNCSTEHAPWYVVPANKKWYRNLVVARIIADTLAALDPHFPPAEEGFGLVQIPDQVSNCPYGAHVGPRVVTMSLRAARRSRSCFCMAAAIMPGKWSGVQAKVGTPREAIAAACWRSLRRHHSGRGGIRLQERT
jgi:hypothetical protein